MAVISTVFVAPSWPLTKLTQIVQAVDEDMYIRLYADIDGSIIVEYNVDNEKGRFRTQKVSMPPNNKTVLSVRVQEDAKDVRLNEGVLKNDIDSAGEIFHVKPTRRDPEQLPYPQIILKDTHTVAEKFFLQTLLDVIDKIIKNTDYELLKLAGLLRLLLIDTPCLIDLANKDTQLRLKYNPADIRLDNSQAREPSVSIINVYNPALKSEYKPSRSRNSFIKCAVASYKQQIITVEDIINACANKKGGVHFDQSLPTKPGQIGSLTVDEFIVAAGKEPSALALRGIAIVTLEGVRPLVELLSSPHP